MKKLSLFIILCCLVSVGAFGQTTTSYRAEALGSLASNEQTPFWMVNHNWGATSLDADNFYLRGSVFHEQQINDDWSFDAGFDLIGGSSSSYGNVWVQQLYGRINWKKVRLDIGSREDYVSMLNPYLSSGDFISSNNARPIPQIKASIPEFILVPYTKGNFYIKGDISLGKYLDSNWQEETAAPAKQNYTQDVLSHQKSIYFRFGDVEKKNKMQLTIGMTHSAQWGGTLYKYSKKTDEQGNSEWLYDVHKQPNGLDDLFRVLIAKEGSPSSSNADAAYVAGSHIGSYLIKYDYRLKNEDLVSAYIHHFFDDGSGMVFENYKDNLLGIEYKSGKKGLLSGVVFEYLYTKHQTGPIHFNLAMDDEHKYLKSKGNGNDNYYNNVDYVQGPSHFGKSMGNPLLLSPEYNEDGALNFKSNRIISLHLGLEGYFLPELQYRLLLTSGQSWGRYYMPYTSVKEGFASQLELMYAPSQWQGFETKLAIGYDNGEFFKDDVWGVGITFSKRGILYSK